MANLYCTAHEWTPAVGFITHEDQEKGSIQQFFNNVFVVSDNHRQWMAKVLATEITKVEAQALVDAAVVEAQTTWDELPDDQKAPILPTVTRLKLESFVLP